jgi:succinyl-diaminopimelate desuccinylase
MFCYIIKTIEIPYHLAVDDPDFHAQIEFIADKPVVSMEKDESIVMIAAEAYKDITGKDPVFIF